MKIYKIKYLVFSALAALMFSSCEIAGLEFQQDAPYETHVLDPQTGISAWDYMNIYREDSAFYLMLEAIKYTGMEAEYSANDRTYMVVQSSAILRYNTNGSINSGTWFGENLLVVGGDTAKTWQEYPVEQVRDFLKYHIVEGVYTFGQNLGPENVKVPTLLNPETITMRESNERNAPLRINDFPFSLRATTARSSNIQTTNGVVHVINGFLVPGTTL